MFLKNGIDDKMDHSINKLVVYFAYPCLIVHNIGELDLTAEDVLADFGLRAWCRPGGFFTFTVFCKGYAPPSGSSEECFRYGGVELAVSMPKRSHL